MSDEKQLTEEEYLRACGWTKEYTGAWYRLNPPLPRASHYLLAEAVEAQLAEDRARLAFVLSRSDRAAIGMPAGDDVFGSATFARSVSGHLETTLAEGEVCEDT
jgi:hypothetical protein